MTRSRLLIHATRLQQQRRTGLPRTAAAPIKNFKSDKASQADNQI